MVDDVRENREVLVDSLHTLGFEVAVAADAHSAIELATASQPALIIMDAVMPGMNGLQAVQVLGRQSGTARIPVIIASADATAAMRTASSDAGASAFLATPLELVSMTETIGRLLSLRWVYDRAAQVA